jgi:putative addiction module CopG family antidote
MARQATLNVSLTTSLRNYVRAKVRSGRYESSSEVIRDGLRALQERDEAAKSFWMDVRDKLAEARADVAAGLTIDGDSAMNELLAELNTESSRKRKKSRR